MTTRMIDGNEPQVEVEGDWMKLSADMTDMVDLLTASPGKQGTMTGGRRDVVVTIAPGAGHGSKACFAHNLGRIEIDGNELEPGIKPGMVRPGRFWGDREKIAATWGLLCHEAAHAVHTKWGTDAQIWAAQEDRHGRAQNAMRVLEAAKLIEEPRIEKQQLDRRPWDERWLRMSASTHLLGELATGPGLTGRYVAMQALTLVGGRVMAGLLDKDEAESILDAARTVLGAQDYADAHELMESILTNVNPMQDASWASFMLPWATSWLQILDRTPDEELPASMTMVLSQAGRKEKQEGQQGSGGQQGEAQDGEEQDGEGGKDQEQDGGQQGSGDGEKKEEEPQMTGPVAEALMQLLEASEKLSDELEAGGGWMPFSMARGAKFEPKWFPATAKQSQGAEALRLRLLEWFMPERSAARVDQVLPPGRLNGRMAVKRAGEKAAGTMPTATPWRHVARRMIPTPPLRAGMVVDVSGSMNDLAPASREIAYRFSTALSGLPDARFRGMLAGESTALLQSKPRQIPHYEYRHGCERVDLACHDLVERLALLRRGNARLLIIISDGRFSPVEQTGTISAMRQVIKAGGRVLWINFHNPGTFGYDGRTPPSCVDAVPGVEYLCVPASPMAAVKAAEEALINVMKDGAAAMSGGRGSQG